MSAYRLALDCQMGARVPVSNKTLHDAELYQLKGTTATFVCKCPGGEYGCADNHIVSRKASPGVLTTHTRITSEGPRTQLPIDGYPFTIAVPNHMLHAMVDGFDLGPVHFTYRRKGYSSVLALVPDRPLPESWLVDIGESYDVLQPE